MASGAKLAAARRSKSNSPIDGSVIARAQKADGGDIEAAIEAAAKARVDFRKIPASDRLEICKAAELMHTRSTR
ncbi:MAG: aldehyde dehydrogenase family protein [Actinomycetota bacterium]